MGASWRSSSYDISRPTPTALTSSVGCVACTKATNILPTLCQHMSLVLVIVPSCRGLLSWKACLQRRWGLCKASDICRWNWLSLWGPRHWAVTGTVRRPQLLSLVEGVRGMLGVDEDACAVARRPRGRRPKLSISAYSGWGGRSEINLRSPLWLLCLALCFYAGLWRHSLVTV